MQRERGPSFPNETEGCTRRKRDSRLIPYNRTKRRAQACVACTLAVREGSSSSPSPAMRAVMAGRVFAKARTRGTLCGAGLDFHGQILRICPPKYDGSRPTAGAMGGTLQQPPAAMLEISRRHSVLRPSLEIERTTMNCHDESGSVPPVASPPSHRLGRWRFGSIPFNRTLTSVAFQGCYPQRD